MQLGAHRLTEGKRALPHAICTHDHGGKERGDDSTAEIGNIKLRR
jgi:hypothetical protein